MKNKMFKIYISMIIMVVFAVVGTASTYAAEPQVIERAKPVISTSSLFSITSTDSTSNGNVDIASQLVKNLGDTLRKSTSFSADDVINNVSEYYGKPSFVYGNLIASIPISETNNFFNDGITTELFLEDQYDKYYNVYVTGDEPLNFIGTEEIILSGYIVGLEDIQYKGDKDVTTHITFVTNQESIKEVTDVADLEDFPAKRESIDYFRILNEYVKYFDFVVDNYDPNDEDFNFKKDNVEGIFSTFLNRTQEFKNSYPNWRDLTFDVNLDEKIQSLGVNDLIKIAYDYKHNFEALVDGETNKAVFANGRILSLLNEANEQLDSAKFDISTNPEDAVRMMYFITDNYYNFLVEENKKDDRYYYDIVELEKNIDATVAKIKSDHPEVYNSKVYEVPERYKYTLKYFETYFNTIKI